ncbi:unnamed protein product, partial [marine sediment metagenome]
MVNTTLATAYRPTSMAIPDKIALMDDGADEWAS